MQILLIMLFAVALAVAAGRAASGNREAIAGAAGGNGAQDVGYLDRRISMLETRLNTMESTLRTLEYRALSQPPASVQPSRDPETALLHGEIQLLKGRLRELACATVHLDERTLSASSKEARRRAGAQASDPCRLNPDAAIDVSTR